MLIFVLKRLFEALIDLCGIMSDPAVLAVRNVLMPDCSVQTTSQLTFSNVADIANGPTLQTFMRGHLALHMESVQQHGVLPRSSLHADRYSRSTIRLRCTDHLDLELLQPRVFHRNDAVMEMMMTWGSWTSASNPAGDTRRPNEPLGAPIGSVVPMFDLTRITIQPLLGEHCFVLRSKLDIRETAARIDDVQCYTLPSIAKLQLPAGIVLNRLLPFRDDIINSASPLL